MNNNKFNRLNNNRKLSKEEIMAKVKKDLEPDKGIEIISKRGKREKHFLQKDGTIVAKIYSDDIHFQKNNKYEEIDNTLIKEGKYYRNKNNSFKVYFKNNSKEDFLIYEIDGSNLIFDITDVNDTQAIISDTDTKYVKKITYKNIYEEIDFEYLITPTKVKENIIIKNKESLKNDIKFILKTELYLKYNSEKSISAIKNGKVLFNLEAPYIIDANGDIIDNVSYKLNSLDNGYELSFIINKDKLSDNNINYPIIIDPTISTYSDGEVYDTYIYPGDASDNCNSHDVLKACVEKVNGQNRINRSLIKFDLPTIGTGSQICEARLNLVGYPLSDNWYVGNNDNNYIDVHRITEDWNESNAKWNNMNDKYDHKIIDSSYFVKGTITFEDTDYTYTGYSSFNITSLVQSWYTDSQNYGVLLKQHNETYNSNCELAKFYSKNNNISGDNPKPTLIIVYRNQNGLESYMNYQSQAITNGMVYQNTFNGNLIAMLQVAQTIGSYLPVNLNIVYNTNDVILNNNRGLGIGFKFTLWQTIKEVTISGINYLEYLDEDGTLHYFINEDGVYKDEDNLELSIEKNTSYYLLTDRFGNKMTFTIVNSIGYLTKYQDTSNNTITINYDSSNRIIEVVDSNNKNIIINYDNDLVRVISANNTVCLNYLSNKLVSVSYDSDIISFSYNDNNCISEIINTDGLKLQYEYYEKTPHKIKKVKEYGLNNEEGSYFRFDYGHNITKITDNKNRVTTISFNDSGLEVCTSDLKNENGVSNAYSIFNKYGEDDIYKNKLITGGIPTKYVKNYLKNTGFENNELFFVKSDNLFDLSLTEEHAYNGNRSLKLSTELNDKNISYSISVPKGKYYTFSCYIKNNAKVKIGLSYIDSNNNSISNNSEYIMPSQRFERNEVSIFYPNDSLSNISINIYQEFAGITYIDNIQLEEGQIANKFNYIENSDFSDGLTGWDLSSGDNDNSRFSIVALDDNSKALKINMDPIIYTSIYKEFYINGKAGEKYTISFWYKDNGNSNPENNYVIISPNFEESLETDWHPEESLNSSANIWQYFSKTMTMPASFDKIGILLLQHDVNEMYITNISLYKDENESSYNYDANGNVIGIYDYNKKIGSYNYDSNNQMIGSANKDGCTTYYEYDNLIHDKIHRNLTDFGMVNEIMYDSNNNPIVSRTIKKGYQNDNTDGLYSIRIKGSNTYVRNIRNQVVLCSNCGIHDLWNVRKYNDDFYTISHSILLNKFFTVTNNKLTLCDFNEQKSLFKLTRNKNGSFSIQDYNNKYLKVDNNLLILSDYSQNDSNFEFYLENSVGKQFIEGNTKYNNNGKYIEETIDSGLFTRKYVIDENTGHIEKITSSDGNVTIYEYDEDEKISKAINFDRKIIYNYNDNKCLKEIVVGNKVYKFIYDDFLNISEVLLNNNYSLIKSNYENNNGVVLSTKYGNNDLTYYTYDEFDRLKTITRGDDVYTFIYNNNGHLVRIVSNNHEERFIYNENGKLDRYEFDNFKIKYSESDDGISHFNEFVIIEGENSHSEQMNFQYVNNNIGCLNFDNNNIQYSYDEIGRLIKSNINNSIDVTIEYLRNGNRMTSLVKKYKYYNNTYLYKYNKSGFITHEYINGKLNHKYYYNHYNELIKEDDYKLSQTIKYNYDLYGNLLEKRIYKINSFELLDQIKYEYNTNWEDQLVEFNGEEILYDASGNVTNINNRVTLTWSNGKQLDKYQDNEGNIIMYNYSHDGLRIGKNINGNEIKYYLDGHNIIFEKDGLNMIYYIRDNKGNLLGFKYNNDLYYYVKNVQEDIIGILNSNYQCVAKYSYDSWGNIVSITDSNDNDISQINNHIANINPFRYRSYYYDKETSLYYLNSRYYNPKWGRFISADGIIGVSDFMGFNLYQYAFNNPINYSDSDGHFSVLAAIVGGVVIAGAYSLIKKATNSSSKKSNKKSSSSKNKNNKKNSSSVSSASSVASAGAQRASSSLSSLAVTCTYKTPKKYHYEDAIKQAECFVKAYGITKETHYSRNDNYNKLPLTHQKEAFKYHFVPMQNSSCHNIGTKGNTKYVGPIETIVVNGKVITIQKEVVFDPRGFIVTDPNNYGTANFAPRIEGIEDKELQKENHDRHYAYDVAAWILWGNSEDDTTSIEQRINAYHKWKPKK